MRSKALKLGLDLAEAPCMGEHNDAFNTDGEKIHANSNFSGGVQGGITNGEEIRFNTAFKPVATISKKQNTVTNELKNTTLQAKGRHDPCVVPRAVPIVEAMAALVTVDFLLRSKTDQLSKL